MDHPFQIVRSDCTALARFHEGHADRTTSRTGVMERLLAVAEKMDQKHILTSLASSVAGQGLLKKRPIHPRIQVWYQQTLGYQEMTGLALMMTRLTVNVTSYFARVSLH
ncbi:hypothetical protein [Acidithiobacillus sp.]|uniref:hypothetical protein n=1 Tax=Acidithiobacillus sp. TaxID=1872118 RepID=UPI0025C669B1|nr:hypothetical protein [Acidithiobacillus sp.]MCK9189880.1 hypothetical protein [Acidithiobacillus sp.]MCK9359197.1 hypothetical protein [Acidithiobacillus sp.]